MNALSESVRLVPVRELYSQVSSPRRFPVVCGEEDFMLGINYQILVVAHDIGNPGTTGKCMRRASEIGHVQRDDGQGDNARAAHNTRGTHSFERPMFEGIQYIRIHLRTSSV